MQCVEHGRRPLILVVVQEVVITLVHLARVHPLGLLEVDAIHRVI